LGHEHFVWFSVFMSKKPKWGGGRGEASMSLSKYRLQPNGDD